MRKSALLAGMALALTGAAAAHAQPISPTATFPVVGSVPEICSVQNPVIGSGGLINFLSLNGTMLQIDQLADSRTLATRAASADVTFNAVCNFAHKIVLESQNNGLWQGGSVGSTPPSGFANGVPYTATLIWGPVNQSLFVDADTRKTSQLTVPVGQPVAGQIELRLGIQAGASNLTANAPLLAGIYSDTLFVTVEPQ